MVMTHTHTHVYVCVCVYSYPILPQFLINHTVSMDEKHHEREKRRLLCGESVIINCGCDVLVSKGHLPGDIRSKCPICTGVSRGVVIDYQYIYEV